MLSHLKVTTMRSSPFLDLRSGTTEETNAAAVTKHTHTHTRLETGNEEVGHLQEEISVTRERYERGTVNSSCPRSKGGSAQIALVYSHTTLIPLMLEEFPTIKK